MKFVMEKFIFSLQLFSPYFRYSALQSLFALCEEY